MIRRWLARFAPPLRSPKPPRCNAIDKLMAQALAQTSAAHEQAFTIPGAVEARLLELEDRLKLDRGHVIGIALSVLDSVTDGGGESFFVPHGDGFLHYGLPIPRETDEGNT